ncbi:hypothetical protein LTS08_004189 [Lithohypha guttulata]|uniref:ribonuclease T2 n=1 Tax=Lithohypha guttulata TaxID=1690604 RepID=A0AAN7T229_9EURO|nr:hypothetical protein LTR05_003670 [Lithohypha guttulata]KAK5101730.1 hypothetical protein LTS08_004189 [Lithohypha guttulata]
MKVNSLSAASLLTGLALAQDLYPGLTTVNHTCAIKPQLRSCPAQSPSSVDTCCTETFGGLILLTQFWSTYTGLEAQGQLLPRDTWTLHGLWPDFCNGSYTQYCDLRRQYDPVPSPNTTNGLPNGTVVPPYRGAPVSTFLEAFQRYDLLDYMNTYWVNQRASNNEFWAHEFSKHATCFSTFQLPCYGPRYQNHSDVIDYFETTIEYYRRFPTWGWLAQNNIRPSNTTQVTLSDVQGTLARASGATPYVGCSGPRYNETDAGRGGNDTGRTVISEAWYYMHVFGRPQEGVAIPVNATGSSSNCARARNALWYYQTTPGSIRS